MGSLSSIHSSKMEIHIHSLMTAVHNSGAPHRLLWSPARCRKGKRESRDSQTQNPFLWPTNLHHILLSHPRPCDNPHSQRQEEQKKHANPQVTESHCLAGFLPSGERGLHHIPIYSKTLHYISFHCIALVGGSGGLVVFRGSGSGTGFWI